MKAFLSLLAAFSLAACKNDPERKEMALPYSATRPLTIDLLAQQSFWTVHYPGTDGILGKTNWRLIGPDNPAGLVLTDSASADDFITTQELHLPEGVPVEIILRSRDVIHSAYFPHLRMQMNAVPGMTTYLKNTIGTTSEEMRAQLQKPDFDYLLLCNKICGKDHFNMRMKVVVETEKEFGKWLKSQRKK